MKPMFTSFQEVKRNLPEALARIKACRKYAQIEQFFIDRCIHEQLLELTGATGRSWFGSDAALQEAYRNNLLYGLEADWLESQVKRIKERPHT